MFHSFRSRKGIGIIAAVLVLAWMALTYNNLIVQRTVVDTAWAGVETQYQRRLDLVPNLVATVEGAANFEKSTFTDVTEARNKATSAQTQNERIEAYGSFDSALSRLLVTVEAYPQLKATQSFQDLMAQLEGTENRVAVARKDYNEAVRSYTVTVSRFPTVLLARLFGFGPKEFFTSSDDAANAPVVDFSS
ncbi:LemA family protein [Candidatus Peregrinibacteria bacterium CG10_big_fil_rev_8_21_14_0_10_49_24]|nr:MAG: LemA family protein [Candidatus Peregrinibacteria bacterium CG11_big_fil_rev_8_21_14_0_20_49_14]PIR50772.1 MAG: LemA family protein [Candidatus Peregrinibacteria bacterium CG10_big_fil_rev_8_21_14_0_10_49_24]PJA68183.1 MAG: LemA family protein [Candidatus Peregrinibacteria bacterium CG_4_9_14_3_um_filter_49_12]